LIARPDDRAHFVYMGRLIYDGPKNVGDFIRALVGIPGNWTATIIDDGEDRESLLALAQALSDDKRITWAGWQDRPWESVDAVSALVLTSESEGFGWRWQKLWPAAWRVFARIVGGPSTSCGTA
jgi:UDP-D-galactose:(glucosyl)LPS alpha-1,6-D-galactosyltransferase